jgi:hypothetical protein
MRYSPSENRLSGWVADDVDRCEKHGMQWSYIVYLASPPRKRKRMMKRLEPVVKRYIRRREKERKGLVS